MHVKVFEWCFSNSHDDLEHTNMKWQCARRELDARHVVCTGY
jgi:hypothetical protein